MNILLLHLSDIHFRKNAKNIVLDRVDEISSAVGSVGNDTGYCFVLITGDIAFSGKVDEYQIAKGFFEQLSNSLRFKLPNYKIEFIFIPGNHDHDFSVNTKVREMLLASLIGSNDADKADNDVIAQLTVGQKNFNEFVSGWQQKSPSVYSVVRFDIPNGEIIFHLINSSWMSTLHEKQGSLLFPVDEVPADNQPVGEKSPYLVIAMLHHPYQWFESNNARKLRTKLEGMSDIVLTGHEHDSDSYTKIRKNSQQTEYVEGGVLQDNLSSQSEFNVILIQPEKQEHTVYAFSWHEKNGLYTYTGATNLPLKRNSNRLRNDYILNHDFDKELSDPGVKFSHPHVDNVFLENIFIYPQIRQLHLPGESEWVKTIVKDQPISFIRKNPRILLIGSEKSGKTAFAKTIFRDFTNDGLVPLFISGEDIKDCDENRLFRLIKQHFENEYSSPEFPMFEQLSKEKKIIIVDNFHKCLLNIKGRDQVIKILERNFGYIVLLGDDQLRFNDLISKKSDQDLSFWNFTTCEILEFGRVKRAELIKNWYSLGQTYTLDESTLGKDMVKVEKMITALIGQNFVPAYPLFILMLLQQLEAQNPVDTNSGSYGYLYESLITSTLSQGSKKDVEIDIQYSYLSELAYALFLSRVPSISYDEIEVWHSKYCQAHKLILDKGVLLKNLYDVSILREGSSGISFRYPYMYYYFVARYLRDSIVDPATEKETKQHICWMSERLHHTESANIIICLCYLSKDPYILTTLIDASHNLFALYDECNLVKDTKFISDLIFDSTYLVEEPQDPTENHKQLLAADDEIEKPTEDKLQSDFSEEKLDRELQEMAQINVAFKTIQILGQLLRNFPSLKGENKFELAKECYSLGLRVLKFALGTLETNSQEMTEMLSDFIKARYPKWETERVNQAVQSLFFSVMEGLSFVVVKHISDSVGLELLLMTYKDLLESTDNVSYRFIDVSVRLDNFRSFPEKEIFSLYKTIRKSRFSEQLLRHFVWHYFYIYPSKRAIRESVCKRLEIQITPALNMQAPKLLND